jgi:hypothetical protein
MSLLERQNMLQLQFVDRREDSYVAQLANVDDARITIRLTNPVLGSLKAMTIIAMTLQETEGRAGLERVDTLFNRIAAREAATA